MKERLPFYNTSAWQNCRKLARQRDHQLCQDCLKKGLIVPCTEVHHIVPVTAENVDDPEVTLNLDNLISLCHECHMARHGLADDRYTVDPLTGKVTLKT